MILPSDQSTPTTKLTHFTLAVPPADNVLDSMNATSSKKMTDDVNSTNLKHGVVNGWIALVSA
jgi:hypothetical protein